MRRVVDGLVAAGFAIALWQLIVWISGAPNFILPSPLRVARTLVESGDLIFTHALTTAIEVLAGLCLGAVLGVGTAIGLTNSPLARRLVLPLLVFSQTIPVFALAPVLTLWLGYGLGTKIVMTVLIIYFPVASAFLDGLTRIAPGMLDLASSMGASKRQIMWRVRFPSALPALGSGLRLAAVYAPIGAVIGEWVGASKGLGYLMLLANGRGKIDVMFASLLVLAAFTILLHFAVGKLAGRLERFAAGEN